MVVKLYNEELNLDNVKLCDGYCYQSLSLCVIDDVFLIGVKHTSTRNPLEVT
ncbi:hypothetical protein KPL35_15240 [Clostridium sp. CF011]|uniref:hypothetical protein n=1 Tax=Clostridium sp. CF011 TaxID=2843318 RepID=UPI001C0C678F|nr:hypothetical protein [Clostridium sp. CF011]MBU3093417.1 hypothetical protein [Clostridium sp. CF011]WAG71264.1 hypothetical protein LL036_07620 [Clostridium sp. CF011]